MDFAEPVMIYTAASNIEAHTIAEMLVSMEIPALAVDDQSSVSLLPFGKISQFHQPTVFVDKSDAERAVSAIRQFEEWRRNRDLNGSDARQIVAVCEDCGESSFFPESFNGTVQECPHCDGYLDVGDIPWDVDVGEPED
jgi:hypothetical protein